MAVCAIKENLINKSAIKGDGDCREMRRIEIESRKVSNASVRWVSIRNPFNNNIQPESLYCSIHLAATV